MSYRTLLLGAALSLPLALAAHQAGAVTVAGSGQGSFSNLSSCDHTGTTQDCRIVSSSNGTNTAVQWGSTDFWHNFIDPSQLLAVDQPINTVTNANDVAIAHLQWYNSATNASQTPDAFGVDWTLNIAFTLPSVSSDSEVFNLTISNPTNPASDLISGLSLADLSGLSWVLNGVVVSDLKYRVVDGSGGSGTATTCAGGAQTCLTNGTWYNVEQNNADLYITADFTAVPEPATLALLGMGLLGVGARRRRPHQMTNRGAE